MARVEEITAAIQMLTTFESNLTAVATTAAKSVLLGKDGPVERLKSIATTAWENERQVTKWLVRVSDNDFNRIKRSFFVAAAGFALMALFAGFSAGSAWDRGERKLLLETAKSAELLAANCNCSKEKIAK